jgi:hypothetical protein
MSDELHQLLRRADESAQRAVLNAQDLSQRIRRTARNQRRVAACGLASVFICSSLLLLHLKHDPTPPETIAAKDSRALQLEIALHERTVAILESRRAQPRTQKHPTDAFLTELKFQRNRAALVLLKDANRTRDDRDPIAVAALRNTVRLFPDTPAAADASRRLREIDSSKEPL